MSLSQTSGNRYGVDSSRVLADVANYAIWSPLRFFFRLGWSFSSDWVQLLSVRGIGGELKWRLDTSFQGVTQGLLCVDSIWSPMI